MNTSIKSALEIIGLVVGSTIIYKVIKEFLFSKLKKNKIVGIIIPIILFFTASFVGSKYGVTGNIVYYLILVLFMMSLFYLMDIMGWGQKGRGSANNKKNDQVIRPKAKPNRVKNNKSNK